MCNHAMLWQSRLSIYWQVFVSFSKACELFSGGTSASYTILCDWRDFAMDNPVTVRKSYYLEDAKVIIEDTTVHVS